MGSADFDNILEFKIFIRESLMAMIEGGQEVVGDLLRRGDGHGGWKAIVRALTQIDVVIGMNRLFLAERRSENFIGAICNHFIGVHVALGARACLPDNQRKVVDELRAYYFIRGHNNGIRQPGFKLSQSLVTKGSGLFL